MEHSVSNPNGFGTIKLSVLEPENKGDEVMVKLQENDSSGVYNSALNICLSEKQLHSFIGTLLHVQQKMKGGK